MNLANYFPIFIDLMLKSAAILAAAAGLLTARRGLSASARSLVWMAAFASLLVLPATKVLSPHWSWRSEVLSEARVVRSPLAPAHREAGAEIPALAGDAAAALTEAFHLPPWRASVIAIWFGGAALLLFRRALASVQLSLLGRRTEPLQNERLQRIAGQISSDDPAGQPVEFRQAAWCKVPVTWGTFRPVVLLPKDAAGWPERRLIAALRHELAHVRRADAAKRLAAQIVSAFYWPNPLVWLGARALHVAQEQACDDLVLRAGGSAEDYAFQLIEAVKTLRSSRISTPSAVALAHPSTLETRVLGIVDEHRNRRPASAAAAGLATIAVALFLVLCTAAQIRAAEAPRSSGETARAKHSGEDSRQIMIQAKFVEVSAAAAQELKLPARFKLSAAAGPDAVKSARIAILESAGYESFFKAMSTVHGADLLSAPRITTRPGQSATIEVVRQIQYPAQWEAGGAAGPWKASAIRTSKVGVMLEAEARLNPDGSLKLKLSPWICEYLGALDLEIGAVVARNSAASGTIADGDYAADLAKIATGHRAKPLFSERQATIECDVKAGQTPVLGGIQEAPLETTLPMADGSPLGPKALAPADLKRLGAGSAEHQIWVFITVTIIAGDKQAGGNPPPLPGEETRRLAERLIIPKIECRDLPASDAVIFLEQQSRAADPGKAGLTLEAHFPPGRPVPAINFSLSQIPLSEALQYVSALTGLSIRYDAHATVSLVPPGTVAEAKIEKAAPAPAIPELQSAPRR